MAENNKIKVFDDKKIRMEWSEEEQDWYVSIVDVVSVLTEQPTQRSAAKYWSVLKVRLKKEGSQLTTNCSQLKMAAEDGKLRLTDVADGITIAYVRIGDERVPASPSQLSELARRGKNLTFDSRKLLMTIPDKPNSRNQKYKGLNRLRYTRTSKRLSEPFHDLLKLLTITRFSPNTIRRVL